MNSRTMIRLTVLAGLSSICSPFSHAAIILNVNFSEWTGLIGDPDGLDDADRIRDTSGNGYHGFWGGTNNNIPVVATPNGLASTPAEPQ
jgi:hypothetical protein